MSKFRSKYQLLVFDLDGLILDSLDGLSNALIEIISNLLQSEELVDVFKEYDFKNPGLSRFTKIDFALNLLEKSVTEKIELRSKALDEFQWESLKARNMARIDETIFDFEELKDNGTNFALLSNCDNLQIQKVVNSHGLETLFGTSIYGTPPSKEILFPKIVNECEEPGLSLSISDSESDMHIAIDNRSHFAHIKQFARETNLILGPNSFEFKSLTDLLSWLKSHDK